MPLILGCTEAVTPLLCPNVHRYSKCSTKRVRAQQTDEFIDLRMVKNNDNAILSCALFLRRKKCSDNRTNVQTIRQNVQPSSKGTTIPMSTYCQLWLPTTIDWGFIVHMHACIHASIYPDNQKVSAPGFGCTEGVPWGGSVISFLAVCLSFCCEKENKKWCTHHK